MPFRVTAFYEMGAWGWSENYYTFLTDVPQVRNAAIRIVNFRLQSMPSASRHVATRVSDVAIRGDALPLPSQGAGSAAWSATVDWGWTAILVRILTGFPGPTGKMFLRPGPETPTGPEVPNRNVIPPAVIASLALWQSELTAPVSAWAIRGIAASQPTVAIKGFSLTGNLGIVTTFEVHGVNPGDLFRIGRVKGAPNRCLNGVFRAETVPTTDSIGFTIVAGATQTIGSGGFLRGQRTVFVPISSSTLIRIVSRKTGRPFGQPLGRRSRRVVCCPALLP